MDKLIIFSDAVKLLDEVIKSTLKNGRVDHALSKEAQNKHLELKEILRQTEKGIEGYDVILIPRIATRRR